MARETCKDFASCSQHQRHTNGFLRSAGGSVLEKMWCAKCGRRWWVAYLHHMVIDARTAEVIITSDSAEFARTKERIVKCIETDVEFGEDIPY